MSGLRLVDTTSGNWTGGYKNNVAADGASTYGFPVNGGSGTESLSTWHNIVATKNGTTWTTYIDGVQTASRSIGTSSLSTSTAPLTIGAMLLDYNVQFGGSNTTIDDVGIYSSVPTAGKAEAIYNVTNISGLSNYNLGTMDQLFGVYDTGTPQPIGSLTWSKLTTAWPSSHNDGDAWLAGSTYYVQFASGAGVTATVPEPSALALLAAGLGRPALLRLEEAAVGNVGFWMVDGGWWI